ncbi:MAG: hypothetical protein KAI84_12640 [Gammaproteobacteria bacterium]|nr:hypothetical protein [Gammaproteobacteria bacterium]
MDKNRLLKLLILLLPLFTMLSAPVYADKKHHDRNDQQYDKKHIPKGYRLDNRFRHDRYYPSSGFRSKVLPQRHYEIQFNHRPYFYSSGIWYLRSGAQFIVTVPPLGIVVPFLPPFYTTLWVRGVPYYYANDVYYTWQPDRNNYVVTNPPNDFKEEETSPLTEQLFIYPKQGQNEKKQADDRYQCHRWSVSQTGYDPSQPPENMTQQALASKHDNYQKALKSCLEGRNYTVK